MTFDLKLPEAPMFSLPVSFSVVFTKNKPTDCEVIDVDLKDFYVLITTMVKTQVVGKFAIS